LNRRLVAIFPGVGLALLALAMAVVPDRLLVYAISAPTVKVIAVVGAVLAATAFGPGDYLRRAWILYAVSYMLLLLPDLIFGPTAPSVAMAGGPQAIVRATFVITSNLASVIGTVLFGFAWRVGGLELPGSPIRRAMLIAIVVAVAIAIVGPSLVDHVRAGGLRGAISIGSDVGDAISFCLMAPVLLTALALRGGRLAWPWAVLFVSLFGWLLFDAAGTIGAWAHLGDSHVRAMEELARCLACTCSFSAGVLQRAAVRPG
jgi:hypothetical protein